MALHPSPAVLAGVAVGTLLAGVAYGALSGSAPLPVRVELRASQSAPITQFGSQESGTQGASEDAEGEAATGASAEGDGAPTDQERDTPPSAASFPVPRPAAAFDDAADAADEADEADEVDEADEADHEAGDDVSDDDGGHD